MRFLMELGSKYIVVAPSNIPQTPGTNVKTQRQDPVVLAERLRIGKLVSVWVLDEADTALRDLVRARKAHVEGLTRAN